MEDLLIELIKASPIAGIFIFFIIRLERSMAKLSDIIATHTTVLISLINKLDQDEARKMMEELVRKHK